MQNLGSARISALNPIWRLDLFSKSQLSTRPACRHNSAEHFAAKDMPESQQYNRRREDQHIDRLEMRLDQFDKRLLALAKVEADISALNTRLDVYIEGVGKLEASLSSLNEAKYNWVLVVKSIGDLEAKVEELKIQSAKDAERRRIWEWGFRVLVGAGGAFAMWFFERFSK